MQRLIISLPPNIFMWVMFIGLFVTWLVDHDEVVCSIEPGLGSVKSQAWWWPTRHSLGTNVEEARVTRDKWLLHQGAADVKDTIPGPGRRGQWCSSSWERHPATSNGSVADKGDKRNVRRAVRQSPYCGDVEHDGRCHDCTQANGGESRACGRQREPRPSLARRVDVFRVPQLARRPNHHEVGLRWTY